MSLHRLYEAKKKVYAIITLPGRSPIGVADISECAAFLATDESALDLLDEFLENYGEFHHRADDMNIEELVLVLKKNAYRLKNTVVKGLDGSEMLFQ